MELEDRTVVHTPEGVELELVLAGAASRFIAWIIDFAIELTLLVLIAIVSGALNKLTGGWSVAIFIVVQFLVFYGYNVFFEVLVGGHTPGKRLNHLRVVDDDGGPVRLQASMIRNLVRLLELLLLYLPALISILATSRNQRLGDIAAGTLVVRDDGQGKRLNPKQRKSDVSSTAVPISVEDGRLWDLSGVTREELSVVRHFLERRDTLNPRARHELALRLAQGLQAKVAGAPAHSSPEHFLETLAQIKAER